MDRRDSPYFILCRLADEGGSPEELDLLEEYLRDWGDAIGSLSPGKGERTVRLQALAREGLGMLLECCGRLRLEPDPSDALELAQQGQELLDEAMLLCREGLEAPPD